MTWRTRGGRVAPSPADDLHHTHAQTFWFAGCTRSKVAWLPASLEQAALTHAGMKSLAPAV